MEDLLKTLENNTEKSVSYDDFFVAVTILVKSIKDTSINLKNSSEEVKNLLLDNINLLEGKNNTLKEEIQKELEGLSLQDIDIRNTLTQELDDKVREFSAEISKVNDILTKIQSKQAYTPKDGVDGKDGYTPIKGVDYFDGESVDKNEVIDEILSQIEIPDFKEISGERIIQEINALDLTEDNKIDASHIKNLPTSKVYGARLLDSLLNVNTEGKVDGSTIVWDESTSKWIIGTGSTGGMQPISEKNQANIGYIGVEDFSGIGESDKVRVYGYLGSNPQSQADGWHIKSVDPTNTDDTTVGYVLNDKWINVSNRTIWLAQSVGVGTASWALIGVGDLTSYELLANRNALNGYAGFNTGVYRIWSNENASNPFYQVNGRHLRDTDPTTSENEGTYYYNQDIWINRINQTIWVLYDQTVGTWNKVADVGGGGGGLTFAQAYSMSTLQI